MPAAGDIQRMTQVPLEHQESSPPELASPAPPKPAPDVEAATAAPPSLEPKIHISERCFQCLRENATQIAFLSSLALVGYAILLATWLPYFKGEKKHQLIVAFALAPACVTALSLAMYSWYTAFHVRESKWNCAVIIGSLPVGFMWLTGLSVVCKSSASDIEKATYGLVCVPIAVTLTIVFVIIPLTEVVVRSLNRRRR